MFNSMLPKTRRLFLIVFLLSNSNAWAQSSDEPRKVALLIANEDYNSKVGALQNPVNDVKLVAASLRKVGFEVLPLVTNASRSEIIAAIEDYGTRLSEGGKDAVGFFYYSGHGFALKGRNYILPVDIDSATSKNVRGQGVTLSDVQEILMSEAPQAAHYLVFDACRTELKSLTKGAKGFQPVQARSGILFAFAAAPGTTASDHGAGSGPYARALADELTTPGQSDVHMFIQVGILVRDITDNEQDPQYLDGIRRRTRFMFGGPGKVVANPIDPTGARCDASIGLNQGGGSSFDSEKHGTGNYSKTLEEVDAESAISACSDAVRKYPKIARYQYQLGRSHVAGKNYKVALHHFKNALQGGYARAHHGIGNLYFYPYLGPSNKSVASKHYLAGAQLGDTRSMNARGWVLLHGWGVDRDYVRGHELLQAAYERKNASAAINLGVAYLRGYGVTVDVPKARSLFQDAYDWGNSNGIVRRADILLDGLDGGVHIRRDQEALQLIKRAWEKHQNPWAANYLGWYHQKGIIYEQDETKALQLYNKSLDKGYIQAAVNLAWLYGKGGAVAKNLKRATHFADRITSLNSNRGKLTQAEMLTAGFFGGVSAVNDARALDLVEEALVLDRTDRAINFMGWLHLTGRGVIKKDYTKARLLFEEAIIHHSASAAQNLGKMYRDGTGVLQSATRAREYFAKAAQWGKADALVHAAIIDFNSVGGHVSRSREKVGLKNIKEAVSRRSAWAMNYLGWLHDQGRAVGKKDIIEAKAWYDKSAALGYALAARNVGDLYDRKKLDTETPLERNSMALLNYNRAAFLGNGDSIVKIAFMARNGRVTRDANNKLIATNIDTISEAGSKASRRLANALHEELLRKALRETGSNWARTQLAYKYLRDKRTTEAIGLLEKGVKLRHAHSAYVLADVYMDKDTKPYSIDTAIKHYELATANGHYTARDTLIALLTREIPGTNVDCKRAKKLMQQRLLEDATHYPVSGSISFQPSRIAVASRINGRRYPNVCPETFLDSDSFQKFLNKPPINSLPSIRFHLANRMLAIGQVEQAISKYRELADDGYGQAFCNMLTGLSRKKASLKSVLSIFTSDRASIARCENAKSIARKSVIAAISSKGLVHYEAFAILLDARRRGEEWTVVPLIRAVAAGKLTLSDDELIKLIADVKNIELLEYNTSLVDVARILEGTTSVPNAISLSAELYMQLIEAGNDGANDRIFESHQTVGKPLWRAIQSILRKRKLYKGPIDGIWGGGTERALTELSPDYYIPE